ncbi:hypothetical protein [Gilliamella apis]|uniref:hypothetical protein n=1 Tax=Gilliamella apis TaxID=1970738 RepID=UPI001056D6C9|nr:hypothetical protein [Gilliamella apis]
MRYEKVNWFYCFSNVANWLCFSQNAINLSNSRSRNCPKSCRCGYNKYSTSRPITVLHSSLSVCIAQELDNSPVVLNSDNYLGSAWWPYYNMPTQQAITINGGDTIKLVEGNNIVANALTDYQSQTKYFISYTLTTTRKAKNIHYLFSNIKQAQQYTDSIANDGFQNVKTLERSHPDLVIDALNKEVDKIQACLLR